MNFECVSKLLGNFIEIGPTGCGVSIYLNGKRVYEHYEGYANYEKKEKITRNTIFRIFSQTKMFTSVSALILYERGDILLNDPLEKYLPEFSDLQVYRCEEDGRITVEPVVNPITIHHLLTMTSGYPYHKTTSMSSQYIQRTWGSLEKSGSFSLREFVKELANIPLSFEPGKRWQYGVSYDILAAVIEEVSGKRFGDFLKEEVFSPLGMSDTGFFLQNDWKDRFAKLYSRSKGRINVNNEYEHNYQPKHIFEEGGAGLISTINDLDKFTNMLLGSGTYQGVKVLGRKTVELMCRNHLNSQQLNDFQNEEWTSWNFFKGYGYGLGVRVLMEPAKAGCNGSIGEFGWAGAAGTLSIIDPKEKMTVNYMQQLRPNNMEEKLHPRLRAAIYACLN